MKKKIHILTWLFLFLIMPSFILMVPDKKEFAETKPPSSRSGTAVIITGAAARIPQEAALLEELYNRGLLKDVVFISGVSSGALNSVVLNAILTGKMTWDEYRHILFSLKNSDIFVQEGKKLPVNTEPERKFISEIVEGRLGYHTIGDLPIMTAISVTHLNPFDFRKTIYRMCSRKINSESDTTLGIVDILMASTAIPVVFPPVRIRNVVTIPDVKYIDGGVGDDQVPFKALLDFEKFRGREVEKVFIISRKSDNTPQVSEELKVLGINDRGVFDKLNISIDNILKKGLIKRLEAFTLAAPEKIHETYVWIPEYDANFLLFDFGKLREQYELTLQWAKTHNPVSISQYLLLNSRGK
ncbi:MAG TPA: patatin-like phospholipase family protein [Bacteroidales bacterium]|nr:patatin-like phospholipase family protein [Bacteroidales bacterium]